MEKITKLQLAKKHTSMRLLNCLKKRRQIEENNESDIEFEKESENTTKNEI